MSTLKFTEEHEWLLIDGDVATVGITDYAQKSLGDIVFVQLPEAGTSFAAGDEAAVIESVKAAGDLKCPVGGTIVEANTTLVDSPATVNEAPFGEGWFVRIHLADLSELSGLLDLDDYEKRVA